MTKIKCSYVRNFHPCRAYIMLSSNTPFSEPLFSYLLPPLASVFAGGVFVRRFPFVFFYFFFLFFFCLFVFFLFLFLSLLLSSLSSLFFVWPTSYLTDLNSLKINSDAEVGDIEKVTQKQANVFFEARLSCRARSLSLHIKIYIYIYIYEGFVYHCMTPSFTFRTCISAPQQLGNGKNVSIPPLSGSYILPPYETDAHAAGRLLSL